MSSGTRRRVVHVFAGERGVSVLAEGLTQEAVLARAARKLGFDESRIVRVDVMEDRMQVTLGDAVAAGPSGEPAAPASSTVLAAAPAPTSRRPRQKARKPSVQELRERCARYEARLKQLGVFVPPIADGAALYEGRGQMHCHPPRGNTKDLKRRRHREARQLLSATVAHLRTLLEANDPACTERADDASGSLRNATASSSESDDFSEKQP